MPRKPQTASTETVNTEVTESYGSTEANSSLVQINKEVLDDLVAKLAKATETIESFKASQADTSIADAQKEYQGIRNYSLRKFKGQIVIDWKTLDMRSEKDYNTGKEVQYQDVKVTLLDGSTVTVDLLKDFAQHYEKVGPFKPVSSDSINKTFTFKIEGEMVTVPEYVLN